MADINTSLIEDTGGWFGIEIYTTEEISICPDFITNLNTSSIVFSPDPDPLDIVFIGETIEITENPKKTRSGAMYSINANFEIQAQNKDIDDFLNRYHHKDVVLIACKHNEQKKIYGSKKFPLALSYQYINGKNYEDGNQVKVSISGNIPQKPAYI